MSSSSNKPRQRLPVPFLLLLRSTRQQLARGSLGARYKMVTSCLFFCPTARFLLFHSTVILLTVLFSLLFQILMHQELSCDSLIKLNSLHYSACASVSVVSLLWGGKVFFLFYVLTNQWQVIYPSNQHHFQSTQICSSGCLRHLIMKSSIWVKYGVIVVFAATFLSPLTRQWLLICAFLYGKWLIR